MIFKFVLTIVGSFLIAFGNITNAISAEKPRIGILTSGGDCSGLNSTIYATYKKATDLGYEVIGFKHGVHGLVN